MCELFFEEKNLATDTSMVDDLSDKQEAGGSIPPPSTQGRMMSIIILVMIGPGWA